MTHLLKTKQPRQTAPNRKAGKSAPSMGRRAALSVILAAPFCAKNAIAAHNPEVLSAALLQNRYLDSAWDRRKLRAVRRETGERFAGVYFEHGAPIAAECSAIDWLLRDVRAGAACVIDRKLIELMRKVQSDLDGRELVITSGFRTPETNAKLSRRGAVRNSLHLTGQAVDFYVPGVPVSQLARIVAKRRMGGVGVYPRRGFVHADLGDLRLWRG